MSNNDTKKESFDDFTARFEAERAKLAPLAPRLTLKSLKIARNLSEETLAFTATVYLDGTRIGQVGNRGHGGCHEQPWPKKGTKAAKVWADFRTTVKETVPDMFEPVDALIDMAIQGHEDRKLCKTHVAFTRSGEDLQVRWPELAKLWTTDATQARARFVGLGLKKGWFKASDFPDNVTFLNDKVLA